MRCGLSLSRKLELPENMSRRHLDLEDDCISFLASAARKEPKIFEDGPLFVSDPPQEYLCQICMKVLQEPHVTECCGQHYCKACLEKWFKNHGNKVCPHCRVVNFVHILYKPLQRKINELEVYCSNLILGCNTTLKLEELDFHHSITNSSGCGYISISCSNGCGQEVFRMKMDDHVVEECAKREATCSYCDATMSHDVLAEHDEVCEEMELTCPRNCGREMRRGELKTHEEECPDMLVKCPFFNAGCQVELMRKGLDEHVEKGTSAHLTNLMAGYNTLKAELGGFKSQVAVEVSRIKKVIAKPVDTFNSLECMESLLKGYHLDSVRDFIMFSLPANALTWKSSPFTVSTGYSMCVSVKSSPTAVTTVELLLLSGIKDNELQWPMKIEKGVRVKFLYKVTEVTSMASHTMRVNPDLLDLLRCEDQGGETVIRRESYTRGHTMYIRICLKRN